MRPVTPGRHAPIETTSRDQRAAFEQEVVVRRTAYGDQIVVRRVIAAGGEERGRTLHIDAVVR